MRQPFLSLSFSTLITFLTGTVVLLGYFTDLPPLDGLRLRFLQWAVLLSAVALLVGVLNLARVHWSRFGEGISKALMSLAFFLGFFVALLAGGLLGIQNTVTRALVDFVIVPIEASLFVVILVVLIYALTRMVRKQLSAFNFAFLATVVLALLGSVPLPATQIPFFQGEDSPISYALRVLGTAGVRGLLIGIALGSAVTGLRVLFGLDRPSGE
ncbi:MAG: hypothetical protein RML93_01960 [Anaerolineales bacterium]|nr:hypothetical protein [Anaerolineales bacterium]MCS7248789.1 hypothetical protein [Anaerolineales bacterium]MDW8162602.1 hypothetical protein [Anaerolineales bacterium]MDW8446038.1 hypothetical protein [Anaerolineales bacterium]